MQSHAELIEALGGGTVLMGALKQITGWDVPRDNIYAWKRNGIAWKYRPAVARLAAEKGVELPAQFLGLPGNALQAAE